MDFPIFMSRQKICLQWKKIIVAVYTCTATVDHVESRF
jgi:hypothetical protein